MAGPSSFSGDGGVALGMRLYRACGWDIHFWEL